MNKVLIMLGLLISFTSQAAYNANMRGEIQGVYVYTDADHIYVILKNQPSSHPACNPNYFVIPASVPYERRQMLLSRLLTAYASKEVVNIGYDATGSCANGYIQIHRVG